MVAPVTLTDEVINIRPLEMGDVPAMYQAVRESLDELKNWMSWAHDRYTERETREWITIARAHWNSSKHFAFAITDPENSSFLGTVSLGQIHPIYHFCNLGYWVRSSQYGHGYAARAACLAARFAFEKLRLVRVEIVIAVGNQRSIKVAEKCGAHHEGTLFNRIIIHRKVYDAVMYSLLPSDFGLTLPT
jgi:RimJ/RimL family protein N-acetyltransferase